MEKHDAINLGNHKGNKNCFGEEPKGYTKIFGIYQNLCGGIL